MEVFRIILLVFLVICSIAASLTKNTLISVIIFMSYSVVMSVIWALLKAPDLAITEAAVGAGVTSVLFFITLKKIRLIRDNEHKENSDENKAE
ncbi:pH adaptation potassium efflux system protein B 1 sodium/hydrogen antiporter subunit [Ruminococcus sp. CAG:382]|nr:DUF4040 domain-containing protein [Ruminococcus sp.]MDD6301550.1 DUF4040 domain-containing protein [Ruminococcus sp.]CDD02922.1 pH adaptation potassium efflux system protein B 1 sodium/hydrogen antiporter subunit [Ruminococcus sp. CAG:382]